MQAQARLRLPIVLLGASGFVGAAVLRGLAALSGTEDVQARLLVHRTMPTTIPAFASVYRGSITNMGQDLLPNFPHVLIHCATLQRDTSGNGYGMNLQGIESLARAINRHTQAILYLSSYSVYGDGPLRGISEDAPLRPQSSLARSRGACERRLAAIAAATRCHVAVFRTRFVLGTGDRFVMPAWARLAQSRLEVGSTEQRYSVIDVDDLAHIILTFACEAIQNQADSWTQGTRFCAFNVAYERPIAWQEIRTLIGETLATPTAWLRLPVHPWWINSLARVPVSSAQRLAQHLRLVGYDQYGEVGKLSRHLKSSLLQADPRDAVRRAVRELQTSATGT